MSETFEPTNIIVTGGCGFIGSNFVHYVVNNHPGVHVTVLDKLTYAGNPENIAGLPADRVELVVGDVCDAELLDRIVPGHDAIVHFAAESHNDNSIADPEPFVRTNVEGTFRLLEACRKHDVRYHHVSTDEVYGDLALDDPARFTEETPYHPSSPYSSTKAASDMLVRAWAPHLRRARHDLQLLEQLRPLPARREVHPAPDHQHPVRGPPQALRRRAATSATGSTPRTTPRPSGPILTKGRVGRDLPDRRGRRDETTSRCCARSCAPWAGPRTTSTGCSDRPGHDRRYAIDTSRSCRRELGWRPRHTDFAEGLAETIAWYRDNEAWWRPAKEATEARYAAQGQ